jgi:hypothetical protein
MSSETSCRHVPGRMLNALHLRSAVFDAEICVQLANPALEDRHWKQVFSIVGSPYIPGKPICVDQLLQLGILARFEDVQAVASVASKEYSMLKMLEKMEGVRCCFA